jgi:hypothetical protein
MLILAFGMAALWRAKRCRQLKEYLVQARM